MSKGGIERKRKQIQKAAKINFAEGFTEGKRKGITQGTIAMMRFLKPDLEELEYQEIYNQCVEFYANKEANDGEM